MKAHALALAATAARPAGNSARIRVVSVKRIGRARRRAAGGRRGSGRAVAPVARGHAILIGRVNAAAAAARGEILHVDVRPGAGGSRIAVICRMHPTTVSTHLRQIFSKLGVETRTAAAVVAWEVLAEEQSHIGHGNKGRSLDG